MATSGVGRGERQVHPIVLFLGFACALAVAIGAWAPDALAVTSPLSWSEPVAIDPGAVIKAISCPSATFCVAVDNHGQALTSTDPTGGAGAWEATDLTHETSGFVSISCPSSSLCIALDGAGNVWSSTEPTAGASAWSSFNLTEGADFASQATISCASASLCVIAPAVEIFSGPEPGGFVYVSQNPTAGALAWSKTLGVDGTQHAVEAMSCLAAPLCVGGGARGDVQTSPNPLGTAGEWTAANVDEENNIFSISCPSTAFCLGGDIEGNVVSSTDPTGGSGAWTAAHVDGGNAIFSVSCASSTLCAAVDDQGNAMASSEPAGGAGAWVVTEVEPNGIGVLNTVSCPSEELCVAGDAGGRIILGTGSGEGGGGEGGGGGGEGGAGGGSGTGGSGGSSSGGIQADLTLGHQVKGGPVVLDGSGTLPGREKIVGFRFRLSSSPGEIACGAGAPEVKVAFAGPTTGTATLTAIGAGGATSTASVPYTTAGPTILRPKRRAGTSAVKFQTRQPLVSAQCQPGPASQAEEVTIAGKPVNASCEVHAGLVDAIGCGLREVQLCSGIPAPESRILANHENQYAGCGVQREARGTFASSSAAGPQAEACAFHCVPVVDTYYASSQPVRVNGLDLVPKPGAAVVIAVGGLYSTHFTTQHAAYLVSSGADVKIGGLPLQLGGQIDYSVGAGETAAHIADFDIRHPLPFLPEFEDLPLTGTLSADLVPGGATELAADVGLPEVFTDEEGNGLTTKLALRTDNVNGLYVNSFHLAIPYALLGDAAIEKAALDYSRPAETLEGKAAVLLPSGDTVSAELGFHRGDFDKFNFDYAFGPGEGIEIFDGIFLTELFGGLRVEPTELTGGSRVSIGPSVTDQGCGSVDVRGNLTIHFGPLPFAIGGTGTNELLCQDVGARYFHLDSDGHAEIGENVKFVIPSPETGEEPPLGKISGELNGLGYVNTEEKKAHFQFDGVEQASLDLFGLSGEYSAEAVVSDLGFGVCAAIDGPFGSKWHPGFGEDFDKVNPLVLVAPAPIALGLLAQNLSVETDSCNVARYRTVAGAGGARISAAAGLGFHVPKGQKTTVLVLHGAGGAPRATLRGPGGRVVDATGAGPVVGGEELVLPVPSQNLTEVQLRGRSAGSWKVEPAAGSAPIAKLSISHELPPPSVRGTVTGKGPHRTLRYRAHVPAGTRITFLEHGKLGSTVIGTTRRTAGTIHFIPSTAKAGRREIVAQLLSPAGTPQPTVKVTTYEAAPPKAGRPTNLRVRHIHGKLRISFTPGALATEHAVTVELSDGRHLFFLLEHDRHSLVVPQVPKRVKVRSVRIRGEAFGRFGPAAKT